MTERWHYRQRPAAWDRVARALVFLISLLAVRDAFPATGDLTPQAFQVQIEAAQRLVAACATNAGACDPGVLPTDAQVDRAGSVPFRASWLWLREAVGAAKSASGRERGTSMQQAGEQLTELAAEATSAPPPGDGKTFSRAQRVAAEVLTRSEFQADTGPTWMSRQLARLQDWILRLLLGMDQLGAHNPWLAPLVEWVCFLLAAGGLLFFVRRTLARQALQIAWSESMVAGPFPGRDGTDWARIAEERGAAGDWREGIHHLYWAAIVSLEKRRAWRPNPTRTPREYLRLLPPGSVAQHSLRRLTGSFERVWYGQTAGTEAEFEFDKEILAEIAGADLKPAESPGSGPDTVPVRLA